MQHLYLPVYTFRIFGKLCNYCWLCHPELEGYQGLLDPIQGLDYTSTNFIEISLAVLVEEWARGAKYYDQDKGEYKGHK